MCEMMTVLAITSAASTVANLAGQQMAADAQAATNRRQYQNTMQARAANLNQTNLRELQEREASAQKITENNMAARGATATARVAAGESGISGLSVDSLLSDLGNKAQRYNSSVTTNYDYSVGALNNQRTNINVDAASAINNLKTPAMPDYFGAALRIGNTAMDWDKKANNGQWFGQ